MTVYGDLDVSVLDEMPPGRTPIATLWAAGPRSDGGRRVGERARRGRRRATRPTWSARSSRSPRSSRSRRPRTTFERLAARASSPGLRLGLLHGRMPPAEKDAIDGRVPPRRARRARRDDRHRGRRRRPERDGDGDPRRRPLRHRPAAPAPRSGRSRRGGVGAATSSARRAAERPRPGSRRWCSRPTASSWPRSTSTSGARARSWASARRAAATCKLASLRRDREMGRPAREVAFELVDGDRGLAERPRPRRRGAPVPRRGGADFLLKG